MCQALSSVLFYKSRHSSCCLGPYGWSIVKVRIEPSQKLNVGSLTDDGSEEQEQPCRRGHKVS